MADDIALNIGSGGDQLAADDIGGVKFQRVKVAIGADGTNDGDVSTANPLPVEQQPNSVSGFVTTSLLIGGASYVSPVLDITSYQQVDTRVVADQDGTMTFEFMDASETVLRTLTIPYVAADGFQLYSAPAFTPKVKYTFTNGVTAQSGPFYFETKLLQSGLSPQVLRVDAFLSPSMVSTLGRSVVTGYDPTSASYKNINSTQVVNDDGTTYCLNVVQAARPSQVQGRTVKQIPVNSTGDVLLHTVTGSKTLYITDMIITVGNSATGAASQVSFQDALSATPGSELIAYQAPEAPASSTSVTTLSHSFQEPIKATTGLFLDIQSGTANVTGLIMGYEE